MAMEVLHDIGGDCEHRGPQSFMHRADTNRMTSSFRKFWRKRNDRLVNACSTETLGCVALIVNNCVGLIFNSLCCFGAW